MSDYTILLIVMDRSGSMSSIRQESENAINEMVKAQKELPGRLGIKLVKFDNEIELDPVVDAGDFPGLKLIPRGLTALHDAMGAAINDLKDEITTLKEQPAKVIAVTITDGAENCSHEYSGAQVKALIEEQKAAGWEFVFLGAGQNAIVTAEALGIDKNSSMTFAASSRGVGKTFSAVTRYITDTRSGIETVAFTDEERADSVLTDPSDN